MKRLGTGALVGLSVTGHEFVAYIASRTSVGVV
jgi:hypothetical protein